MIWKIDAKSNERPIEIAERFAATELGTPRTVDLNTFLGAWVATRFEATFRLIDGVAQYVMRGRDAAYGWRVAIYRLDLTFLAEGATDAERLAVLRIPPQIADQWHQLSYLEGWLRFNRQKGNGQVAGRYAARDAKAIARIEGLLWPRS